MPVASRGPMILGVVVLYLVFVVQVAIFCNHWMKMRELEAKAKSATDQDKLAISVEGMGAVLGFAIKAPDVHEIMQTLGLALLANGIYVRSRPNPWANHSTKASPKSTAEV